MTTGEGALTEEQTRRAMCEIVDGAGGQLDEDSVVEGILQLDRLGIASALWHLWVDGKIVIRWGPESGELEFRTVDA